MISTRHSFLILNRSTHTIQKERSALKQLTAFLTPTFSQRPEEVARLASSRFWQLKSATLGPISATTCMAGCCHWPMRRELRWALRACPLSYNPRVQTETETYWFFLLPFLRSISLSTHEKRKTTPQNVNYVFYLSSEHTILGNWIQFSKFLFFILLKNEKLNR